MYLKMYLDKVLLDQALIEYEGLLTCSERQEHQERLATELAMKHAKKIKQSNTVPMFAIVVQSQLNLFSEYKIDNLINEQDEQKAE
jgi:hypothetical protein